MSDNYNIRKFVNVNKKAVFTIKQYSKDTELNISIPKSVKPQINKRGVIKELTMQSVKRLRLVLRNLPKDYNVVITLTYPKVIEDIRQSKTQLNSFLQYIRRKSAGYVWVSEFQNRGAIHYHVVVNKMISYKEINDVWKRILKMSDDEYVRTEIKKVRKDISAYLAGYLNKMKQKNIPKFVKNMGRFWGNTRGILKLKNITQLRVSMRKGYKMIRILNKWYQAKLKSWGIRGRTYRMGGRIYWDGAIVTEKILMNMEV